MTKCAVGLLKIGNARRALRPLAPGRGRGAHRVAKKPDRCRFALRLREGFLHPRAPQYRPCSLRVGPRATQKEELNRLNAKSKEGKAVRKS